MIQFNLLPDVKNEYLKARRSKRLVIVGAMGIAGVSLAIMILLFLGVSLFQKKHLSDLSRDIKTDSQKLQATPDLNKILTIQNQLRSLPNLHAQKPVASRLFGYLTQITPGQVSISNLDIDFDAHTMDVKGSADSISTINKFVDTLKFTTYTVPALNQPAGTVTQAKSAFSDVVLSNFGLNNKVANYEIIASFDAVIFDSANVPTLTVPQITTTRSALEKPTELFQPSTSTNSTKP